MVKETEYEKQVQAEVTRLQKQEAEKRFLHDRTVDGENAPRPTREYIERCVGPLKSEAQMRREAELNVQRQRDEEQREQARREAVERSMREHTQRVEQQQKEQQAQAKQNQVDDLANKLRHQREQRGLSKTFNRES